MKDKNGTTMLQEKRTKTCMQTLVWEDANSTNISFTDNFLGVILGKSTRGHQKRNSYMFYIMWVNN